MIQDIGDSTHADPCMDCDVFDACRHVSLKVWC
jgi:hypothetical protein